MKVAAVFAVLSLLLAPVTASAACAWVLWAANIHQRPTAWETLSAFESKEECEAHFKKTFPIRRNDAGGVEGPGVTFMHQCLPDNVDPRGPKGGR